MNRSTYQLRKPVARFRQYSRKGYAIFSSLGRCVTIGCLKKNITEQAFSKQSVHEKAMLSINKEAGDEINADRGEEETSIKECILLQQLTPLINENPIIPVALFLSVKSDSFITNYFNDRNASCPPKRLFIENSRSQDALFVFIHFTPNPYECRRD